MPSAAGIDVLKGFADGPASATGSPRDSHGLRARFRRDALELLRREELLETAWSYRIVPYDGEVLPTPRLVPETGRLTGLACAVCTLGPKLERRVSALFAERRMSLALALDDLGNALLLELVRRLQDRMLADVRRQGLTMAGELRAGDPGLALEAQATILRLAGAEQATVTLSGAASLHPLKSASMVFGVGIDLPPARWSRCDDCRHKASCRVAREMA